MQRITSLAVAGLLTAGLTACGTSPADTAGGSSPSPTVTAPPDEESCTQAKTLALVAGLRMAGVSLALDMRTQADAAEQLDDVVEQADQVKAKVTDARVKAIVDEYRETIDQLKKQLDAPGADTTKLLADVDVAIDKFDKAEEKLSAICLEKTPAPGGSSTGLAADCESFDTASIGLFGPMMGLASVGSDKAEIRAAVDKALKALDDFTTELSKIAAQTANAELKAAMPAALADIQKMKSDLVAAGTDAAKLKKLMDSEPPSPGMDRVEAVCSAAR